MTMHEDRCDPDARPSAELTPPLRQAVEQARDADVPEEVLTRALQRAHVLGAATPVRRFRPDRRLLLGAAAAVLLLVSAALWLAWPAESWADVARAVQGKPWVHGTAKLPDGETTELWFAPGREVIGMRDRYGTVFYDQRLRIVFSYKPEEKLLYRVPDTWGSRQEEFRALQRAFRALFRADASLDSPLPNADVVGQQRRRVRDGDRQWTDYEVTLRLGTETEGPLVRLVFRVDPQTHLPHALTFRDVNPKPGQPAQEVTYLFDYPDKGPADVHDLGVPRTAKLVDRVPENDLGRVLGGIRAGRDRLAPYHAVVAKLPGRKTGSVSDLLRIWHQGRRWRIESGMLGQLRPAPGSRSVLPDDLDAWWRSKLEGSTWVPVLVCDGRGVHEPDYARGGLNPQGGDFRMTQRVSSSGDSLAYAQAYGTNFPEFWAYPDMPVPSEQFEAALETRAAKGTPGTVALIVRMSKAESGHHGGEAFRWHRYWVDPTRDYVLLRAEWSTRFPEDAGVGDADPAEAPGFVEVSFEGEKYERSPSGVWYPTLARQQRRGQDGKYTEEFYRFRLDFPVEIGEDHFKPAPRTGK
jgi:hypothetical protein